MIGKRITALRKQEGLTQTQLAQKLGLTRSSLSLYELGKREPDLSTLVKIAYYFNVNTDYLLGISDSIHDAETQAYLYPYPSNRLGKILKAFRSKKNLSSSEMSNMIEVPVKTYEGFEAGMYFPKLDILKKISQITTYDVDYLTGANNKAFSQEEYEADTFFFARFEYLCTKNHISDENVTDKLGISHDTFIDITFNRMPTLLELLRIACALNVPLDYLIGRTDNPILKLSDDELDLILNYRDCLSQYKRNILNRVKALSIESVDSLSVADSDSKTDNSAE